MSRPYRLTLAAGAALAALMLGGCTAAEDAPTAVPATDGETRTVASAYGEVTVPAEPQRVAAAAYYTVWQLWSLDIDPIATLDYTQQKASFTPEQWADLEKADPIGTFQQINYEALSASAPDLIIGDAFDIDEATYARLSEIAPTVVAGGSTARGDWQTITREMADALGKTEVWEASKVAYEKLRDETVDTYRKEIEDNAWVVFSEAGPGLFSLQLPGGATGNLLFNELGLTPGPNVPMDDPDSKGWQAYPLEQLPSAFEGATRAITFATSEGSIYPQIQEIIDSPVFQSTTIGKTGAVGALSTDVNDYEGAQAFIREFTTVMLDPTHP